MLDKDLIATRAEFDAGNITETEFASVVNFLLSDIAASVTPEQKIECFDKLAAFFPRNYEIDELVDGKQAIKNDLAHYLFEDVLSGIFGEGIFDFYNKTYESF